MAITVLSSIAASPGLGGGSSGTINSTGASLLVVLISTYAGTTSAPTFTDSASNTWRALPRCGEAATNNCVKIYYCVNPTTSSTHSVSITGTSIYLSVAFYAVSGTDLTSPLSNVEGIGSGTNSATSFAVGAMMPSVNNCIVFAVAGMSSAVSAISIDSGMTALTKNGGASACGLCAAYIVQTTAAAISPTVSYTTASAAAGYMVAFKPPANSIVNPGILVGGQI